MVLGLPIDAGGSQERRLVLLGCFPRNASSSREVKLS